MVIAAILVERATSNALIGPDWAMNLKICDILNHDPGQTKDVVKAMKKRLGNKNPNVQLLALTVLETVVRNCGAIVRQQVVEKNILQKMVKIAKKKPEMHVKDKILGLLNSWQEAFGGPGGGFPQYYLAYEELQRMGMQFPERASEDGPPVLSPAHKISTYRAPDFGPPSHISTRLDASVDIESPPMCLTDIETARGTLEVLIEMLNAVNLRERLAVKDDLIAELVEQCRTTQGRVTHLVNVTTNEELLRQGLALNDDLQRVLSKHDAILSGAPLPKEEPLRVPSDQPSGSDHKMENRTERSSNNPTRATSNNPLIQLALSDTMQSTTSKVSPPSEQHQPPIDLLSGDVFEDRSTHNPASSPLRTQSPGELFLYSPHSEAGNHFSSGPVETVPPLQYPFSPSNQQQSFQQHPSNGNPQHYASSNGSLQQSPSNGNVLAGFQVYTQQPFQMYQTSTVIQPIVQPIQNNYVASWSMAGRQSPPPQQNGLVSRPGIQNPCTPPQQSSYPPAPWSESATQPISPQRRAMLYGNHDVPVMSPQMQLYSQQQAAGFNQQMRLYPGGDELNMLGQPRAELVQNASQQFSGQFVNGELGPYSQETPFMTPSRPVNPADKLFNDLVDLHKVTSKRQLTSQTI